MTIKELAEFVKKDERTIRRWIKKTMQKNILSCDKMSQGGYDKMSHGIPYEENKSGI